MINGIEKLPHVALERETRPRVVPALPPDHILGGQHAPMRSLADATRKRIGNKTLLKNGINDGENGVMQNPVAHRSFVDMPLLGIGYVESGIRAVLVSFVLQLAVKLKNVFFESPLEPHYVGFSPLVSLESVPRGKEIFRRNYLIE